MSVSQWVAMQQDPTPIPMPKVSLLRYWHAKGRHRATRRPRASFGLALRIGFKMAMGTLKQAL